MITGDKVRIVNETLRFHMWEGHVQGFDTLGQVRVRTLDGQVRVFTPDELELITPGPTNTPPRSKVPGGVSQE